MSKETALDFINALKNDASLRMKVSQLGPNEVDSVLDIAALSGYVFSKEDYLAAIKTYEKTYVTGSLDQGAMEGGNRDVLSRLPGFQRR